MGQTALARTMASNFRTAMFHIFGGLPWLTWYLAIGDVPEDLVQLANDYLTQQAQDLGGRKATTQPHPNPKLSARGWAMRKGETLPLRTGVQHKISQGKELRKKRRLSTTRSRRQRMLGTLGFPT